MSSVPYVPPDTMKKVAATRGHNVSFAAFCFAVGIARAGSWAGNEMVLNSYSRPPTRNSLSTLQRLRAAAIWTDGASSHPQNTRPTPARKKKIRQRENCPPLTPSWDECTRPFTALLGCCATLRFLFLIIHHR